MLKRQIFRQESLQHLATPEELDRLFSVVGRPAWTLLGTLGGLCALAVVWGVFGRVPETVDGAGVLVNPGKVRGLQAPAGGQVIELRVRVGQPVARGEVIATLNQPELVQQRDQALARLRQLRRTDEVQRGLEEDRLRQEKAVRAAQKELLTSSMDEVKKLALAVGEKTEQYTRTERAKLQQNLREAKALNKAVRDSLASLRELRAKRVATADTVLTAESAVVENDVQLAGLDLKLAELGIKDLENQQYRLQQQNRIVDLNIQLKQLEVGATQLQLEVSQKRADRAGQIQEQDDRVKQLETALEEQGKVKSPSAGRILELSTHAGQILQPGARVGAVELSEASPGEEDGPPRLTALAYFPLRSGKRIRRGMQVRVTPSTVQRERFGSILGEVTYISPFPITEEAAATRVGNTELVRALMQPGGMIEVEIELQRDPSTTSGFRWTSAGPPLRFSPGTTAGVRVTVEERRPVTYLLPILRSTASGTSGNEGAPGT
jgi:HlyD family secretion protein